MVLHWHETRTRAGAYAETAVQHNPATYTCAVVVGSTPGNEYTATLARYTRTPEKSWVSTVTTVRFPSAQHARAWCEDGLSFSHDD